MWPMCLVWYLYVYSVKFSLPVKPTWDVWAWHNQTPHHCILPSFVLSVSVLVPEVSEYAVEGSIQFFFLLRLGRGCNRAKVAPLHALRPPRTHNHSDEGVEERRTAPRSDCRRRLLCLSVNEDKKYISF